MGAERGSDGLDESEIFAAPCALHTAPECKAAEVLARLQLLDMGMAVRRADRAALVAVAVAQKAPRVLVSCTAGAAEWGPDRQLHTQPVDSDK